MAGARKTGTTGRRVGAASSAQRGTGAAPARGSNAPAARLGAPARDTADPPKAEPPFSSAHFRVLIGTKELGFCQISRLQALDAETTIESAQAFAVRPASVVLRRAITQSNDLYLWRERTAAGKRDLRTVTIHQCDPTGSAIVNTFVLHGCRPVKWSGPEFNALGNDIVMEELEICCDRLEWV